MATVNRIEVIGDCTLYLGDCMEVMQGRKCLSGFCRSPVACDAFGYCRELNFDAIVTDPPEQTAMALTPSVTGLSND
jgi:hypothetical protein